MNDSPAKQRLFASGWWFVAVVGVGLAVGVAGRELLRRRRMTAREAILGEWEGEESLAEADDLHPERVMDACSDDPAANIELLVDEPRRWASVG